MDNTRLLGLLLVGSALTWSVACGDDTTDTPTGSSGQAAAGPGGSGGDGGDIGGQGPGGAGGDGGSGGSVGSCGDGNVDPGEACDDGNVGSHDGCSDTCATETLSWEQQTATGPSFSPRTGAVWDDGTNLFAYTGSETWSFDGGSWQDLAPNPAPTGGATAATAYDETRNALVLYNQNGQTWEFNGSVWSQKAPTNDPGLRAYGNAVFDSFRGRVILFGGFDLINLFNDTWQYDGQNWLEINTATDPPGRFFPAMAYDIVRDRIIMFGGCANIACSSAFNDLWEFDGSNWTEIVPPTVPSASGQFAMAYDSHRDTTVIFNAGSDITYEYDGTTITALTLGASPDNYGAVAYSPIHRRLALIGGGGGNNSDFWFFGYH